MVELGPTARGVVLLPPDVSESELNRLEAAGIRGARLNTQNPALKETLTAWAPKFKAINWHVQIVGQLPIIVSLGPQIATLGHPVVIDHFGGARGEDGVENKDFQAFLELVKAGNVYVKLSAPYDRTREPGYANMTPFARALIAARADRMLWGTNWPHPLPQQGVPITPDLAVSERRQRHAGHAPRRMVPGCGDAQDDSRRYAGTALSFSESIN